MGVRSFFVPRGRGSSSSMRIAFVTRLKSRSGRRRTNRSARLLNLTWYATAPSCYQLVQCNGRRWVCQVFLEAYLACDHVDLVLVGVLDCGEDEPGHAGLLAMGQLADQFVKV